MILAIKQALNQHFGESLPVYDELPEQDVSATYIFVHPIHYQQTHVGRDFFRRDYFFDIRFHPDLETAQPNRRIAEISEELSNCLQSIKIDNCLIRASTMRSEVQAGVLHFFVDYPLRVRRDLPPEPTMQMIDIDSKIKEE